MHDEVLAPYDAVSIGEALGVEMDDATLFTDSRRGELSMIFHFDIVRLGRRHFRQGPWTLPQMKALYTAVDAATGSQGWNTSFLSNHDSPRVVSAFGDDDPAWRDRSAKALATLVLTQRATPFVYQGDELGMTNYPFERIEQYDDVEVKGLWRTLVETGRVAADDLLGELAKTSRDHSRTPMQWSAEPNGGFTTGTPWLAVNDNYVHINAAAQRADPESVFHHMRGLIALRRAHPALVHGAFTDLDPSHEQVFAYTRTLDEEQFVVLINFGRTPIDYELPEGIEVASDGDPTGTVHLDGWQSLVTQTLSPS
jgi:oligo-1,6-glucosidase